jgi:hypothetical protein
MIEVVRGRLSSACADELLAFWAGQRALPEDEARRRLSEVVCVLRRDGVVAGVTSVYPADIALIGGRRFWVYRTLLTEPVYDRAAAMMGETFRALDSEFAGELDAPIGLCALLAPAQRRLLPAEADWPDPRTLYAGYLEDGRQVRVAYFDRANIIPAARMTYRDWQLGPGYTVDLFAEQDAVSAADVIALWKREAGLGPAEAERRLGEVIAVATDAEGHLAGISTAYLQRNDQLLADMWYLRGFVAEAHRRSSIVIALAVKGRDDLVRRYADGEDRLGIGLIFEVESELLKRAYPVAYWPWTDVTFVGENARGDDVRVHYFPGVLAPEPDQTSG